MYRESGGSKGGKQVTNTGGKEYKAHEKIRGEPEGDRMGERVRADMCNLPVS